jgi:hypothetical protein
MKREKWEGLIAEQKESGLTVSDFCRMKGIARKTFSYQKSFLKAGAASGSFVQIGAPCTIELTLANGITMRVSLTHLPDVLKVING